jgi:hypothetical protein
MFDVVVKVVNSGGVSSDLTLAIAVLGLVLGAVSFAWQVISRQLDDPRLKVRLKRAWMNGTAVITGPVGDTNGDRWAAEQGYRTRLLAAVVENRGRHAISIEGVSSVAEDGTGFQQLGAHYNPERPYRLEPFSSATWYVPLDLIEAGVETSSITNPAKWGGKPQKVRLVVSPTVGDAIKTKDHLLVRPSSGKGSL